MTLGFVPGKDSNASMKAPKRDVTVTIEAPPVRKIVTTQFVCPTCSWDLGTVAYVALGCTILIGLAIILPIGLTEAGSGE